MGGFLRDVAIEGLTVVPLDESERPEMSDADTTNTKRHSLKTVLEGTETTTRSYTGCRDGCSRVNDHCRWLDPNPGDAPDKQAVGAER